MIMNPNLLAEQAIISTILADARKVIPQLLAEVTTEMFGNDVFRDIYSKLLAQYGEFGKVDYAAIIDNLSPKYGAGDMRAIIAEITGAPVTVSHMPLYVKTLQQHHKLRVMEGIGNSLALGQLDVDVVDETIEKIVEEIGQLQRKTSAKRLVSLKAMTLKNYQALFQKESLKNSVKTGYRTIDAKQNYLHPSNFAILAARPGVGKSAMAASLAINIAKEGKKTAFYSMEMSALEIYERLIANKAKLNLGIIQNREISDVRAGDVATAASELSELDLYINDSGYQTVERIRAEVQLKGVQVVIVDYIQLLSSTQRYNNRNEKVGEITRGLKMMAQDLNVIVIALSQLNRERDEFQEPSLSSLRDSGAIEQDANIVWFMWLNGEPDPEKASKEIAFKIAKNRNGELGSCVLDYIGGVMRFEETDKSIIKPERELTSRRPVPWEKD